LDIETEDACIQCSTQFIRSFANTGKHHLGRIAARCQHAGQLAAGDDVETGAHAREQVEDGQAGVGLDGEAHQMVSTGKTGLEFCECGFKRLTRIDVAGGAISAGNLGQCDIFGMQRAVLSME